MSVPLTIRWAFPSVPAGSTRGCTRHDVPFTVVTRKSFTASKSSAEFADGAQKTPPALPFRYPGNFIRESVSYFGQCLPIPMRNNFGFVTHTLAVLGTLWHRCRLLNYHSCFSAHRPSLVIHSRIYAGQFLSWMPSASQRLRNLTAS